MQMQMTNNGVVVNLADYYPKVGGFDSRVMQVKEVEDLVVVPFLLLQMHERS
jgi:hypothetical protein